MDIKETIEEAVKKISSDKDFKEEFEKDPTKALEKVLGVDLPDEQINAAVAAIKAKLTVDNLGEAADVLKKLF